MHNHSSIAFESFGTTVDQRYDRTGNHLIILIVLQHANLREFLIRSKKVPMCGSYQHTVDPASSDHWIQTAHDNAKFWKSVDAEEECEQEEDGDLLE